MKCQKCGKNEANVHLKQNINGVVNEYSLCGECAEAMGYGGMFSGFGGFGAFGGLGGLAAFSGLDSLLGGMLGYQTKTLPQMTQCKLCGSTFEDIARRGKAGCAECYETFGERLAPTVERLHGRAKHIGKLPRGLKPFKENEKPKTQKPEPKNKEDEKAGKLETVEELRAQIQRAIAKEDYETAAKLRDRIKEMEK